MKRLNVIDIFHGHTISPCFYPSLHERQQEKIARDKRDRADARIAAKAKALKW